MASEAGVLDLRARRNRPQGSAAARAASSSSTRRKGRIVPDEEIKRELAAAHPYADWLRENLVDIDDLPAPPYLPRSEHEAVIQRQRMFGYTDEDLRLLLTPMATNGEEPIGSMGTDSVAGRALGPSAPAVTTISSRPLRR